MEDFRAVYVGDSGPYFTEGKEYYMYKDVDGYWVTMDDKGNKHIVGDSDKELNDKLSFINTHFKIKVSNK